MGPKVAKKTGEIADKARVEQSNRLAKRDIGGKGGTQACPCRRGGRIARKIGKKACASVSGAILGWTERIEEFTQHS